MLSPVSPTRLLAAAFLLLAPASAIVVTYPKAGDVWTQGSLNNTVEWAMYPLTFPAPVTQYFDIWMRNGIGSVYPAPDFLNVSIATNVDYISSTSYTFLGADQFIPANGYQLFLAQPGDAKLIYTESEVFYIAAPPAASSSSASSSSSTASSSSTDSSSFSSSSSSASPSYSSSTSSETSSSTPSTSESIAPSTSTSASSSSAQSSPLGITTVTVVSTVTNTKLHAATVPGGLLEQGVIGLSGSGAVRHDVGSWLLAAGAGIIGYVFLV